MIVHTILFSDPEGREGRDDVDIFLDTNGRTGGFKGTVIPHEVEGVKRLGEGDLLIGARMLAYSYKIDNPIRVSHLSRVHFFTEE